jgi:pyridoxamine 5'-phosphate oxidase family protein
MSFTEEEIAYIRSQPLARLSTVDAEGQPEVTPASRRSQARYPTRKATH